MESTDTPLVDSLFTVTSNVKLDLPHLHKLYENGLIDHVIYSQQEEQIEIKYR
jgi:hypothetical protein